MVKRGRPFSIGKSRYVSDNFTIKGKERRTSTLPGRQSTLLATQQAEAGAFRIIRSLHTSSPVSPGHRYKSTRAGVPSETDFLSREARVSLLSSSIGFVLLLGR